MIGESFSAVEVGLIGLQLRRLMLVLPRLLNQSLCQRNHIRNPSAPTVIPSAPTGRLLEAAGQDPSHT
jgi:hypothetical protein